MKLWIVWGFEENDYALDGEVRHFYGVYSTAEKAIEIKDNLEKSKLKNEMEVFLTGEITVDEPTELYNFMTTR